MGEESKRVGTVTLEVTYDDAMRLWVLIHDPANAGERKDIDARLRSLIADAIAITERDYAEDES